MLQSWKVIAFTVNLIVGLVLSQVVASALGKDAYHLWVEVVQGVTMCCLSFIMINVGYEFTVDKSNLIDYLWDYMIAMTAAGFPWLFVGLWYILFFADSMAPTEALLVARFSAPTSAGILFSMLEGAGLKDTWVFQRARILAIFDDLDTIVLMVPLKVAMVGFKFELVIVILIIGALLIVGWRWLHRLPFPHSWPFTLVYAVVITLVCKAIHYGTGHSHIEMEPIHIEVLLPAFIMGCIADTPCAEQELQVQRCMAQERKRATLERKLTRALENGASQSELSAIGDLSALGYSSAVLSTNGGTCAPPPKALGTLAAGQAGDYPSQAKLPASAPTDGGILEKADPSNCAIKQVIHQNWVSDRPTTSESAKREDAVKPPRLSQGDEPRSKRAASKDSNVSLRTSGTTGSTSTTFRTRYGLPREASKDKPVSPCASGGSTGTRTVECVEQWEERAQTWISLEFMVLVGLSMPALFGHNANDAGEALDPGEVVFHVAGVSALMILGKMFPACCYREEVRVKDRLALCLGMCPRGEVGASIIVIALELDVRGPAVIVSMFALAINLVMSGGFIAAVKALIRSSSAGDGAVLSGDPAVKQTSLTEFTAFP